METLHSIGGIAAVFNGIVAGFVLGWGLCALLRRRDGDRPRAWFRAGDHWRHVEEVATELLRAELRAGRCRDTYAYNVGQNGIIKVAAARQYHFAMFAGVKDFWKCVPLLGDVPEIHLSPAKLEEDLANADRHFARIDDGNSKTYVNAPYGIVVSHEYDCARATAEEVRQVIDNAKRKAHGGKRERQPVE
ncbi:MAG: hypothetical protein II840_11615 [Kiritimatiellae bacterium]|nr:hypothetical protein [Kiritimatiellia bacterium]